MGERTQMLIRMHDHTGKVRFSTILHYTWGYGRRMPMDALNLIIQMPSCYELQLKGMFSKGYEFVWFDWFGTKSHGTNYYTPADSVGLAFFATEEDLWKCSNNDGFMIMDLYTRSDYLEDDQFDHATLAFYGYDYRDFSVIPLTFDRYCQKDDYLRTDGDFRRGYKCMVRSYNIKLIEPSKKQDRLWQGISWGAYLLTVTWQVLMWHAQ